MLKYEVISANKPEGTAKLRITAKGSVLLYRPIASSLPLTSAPPKKVAVVIGKLVNSISDLEIGDHVDHYTWVNSKPFYGEVRLIQE